MPVIAPVLVIGGSYLNIYIPSLPADREYQLRIQELESISADLENLQTSLENLQTFVNDQRQRISDTQSQVEQLEQEKVTLQPLVDANREFIDRILGLRRQDFWWNVLTSFSVGVFSGVVATIVAVPLVPFVWRNRKNKGKPK